MELKNKVVTVHITSCYASVQAVVTRKMGGSIFFFDERKKVKMKRETKRRCFDLEHFVFSVLTNENDTYNMKRDNAVQSNVKVQSIS